MMETLGQIKPIADKIRTSSYPAICALYCLMFEEEGDRTSRNQLRAFRGFDFDDASGAFRAKFKYSATFSIGDLTSMCNILGLDYAGTKEELRQKIIRALMDIKSLVPQDDDDDVEIREEQRRREPKVEELQQQRKRIDQDTIVGTDISSSDGADSESSNEILTRRRRRHNTKITFTFKDVEDIIRPFDGSSYYPVEKWISDFEDLATMFKWNEMQKLIFGRKSLKGDAKIFVRSLKVTKSWENLKFVLRIWSQSE